MQRMIISCSLGLCFMIFLVILSHVCIRIYSLVNMYNFHVDVEFKNLSDCSCFFRSILFLLLFFSFYAGIACLCLKI